MPLSKLFCLLLKNALFSSVAPTKKLWKFIKRLVLLLKESASLEKPLLLTSLEGVSQKKAIEGARLVITNYGYLGRQGMTCKKHPYIEVLLKGRSRYL
jgi:hypothetical protein